MQELLTVAANSVLIIGIGYLVIGFILGLTVEKTDDSELTEDLEVEVSEEILEELFPEPVEKELEIVEISEVLTEAVGISKTLPDTRDELRAIAKAMGVLRWSRMSKAELIMALS